MLGVWVQTMKTLAFAVKTNDSGGIRTHASEETGALNQRLRPLGHATLPDRLHALRSINKAASHSWLYVSHSHYISIPVHVGDVCARAWANG